MCITMDISNMIRLKCMPETIFICLLYGTPITPTPCWSTLRSWSRDFWLDEASFRHELWRSGHMYSMTSLTVVVLEPPSRLAEVGIASSRITPRSVVSCKISHHIPINQGNPSPITASYYITSGQCVHFISFQLLTCINVLWM